MQLQNKEVIWNKENLPDHSFLMWIIMNNTLQMSQRVDIYKVDISVVLGQGKLNNPKGEHGIRK